MPDIRNYVIIALVVLTGTLGLSTCSYRTQYRAARMAVDVQNAAVKAQNDLANAKLIQLTKERDREYLEREKESAERAKKLADLQRDLDHATIRVRILTKDRDAGGSGGVAQTQSAVGGKAGETATTGLLPTANSRRLKQALTAIEQLNDAYGSCRAALCRLDVDECSSGG